MSQADNIGILDAALVELELPKERFLARVLSRAISGSWRVSDDFLDYFSAAEIVAALRNDADVRVPLLVETVGLHAKIAEMKSVAAAGEDLQLAVEAGIADARSILALFPLALRVRRLDQGRLWRFAVDGDWLERADSGSAEQRQRAADRVTYVVEAAVAEDLLSSGDLLAALEPTEVADLLSPPELRRAFAHALDAARHSKPVNEGDLLGDVGVAAIVERASLRDLWVRLVVERVAEPLGLAEEGDTVANAPRAVASRPRRRFDTEPLDLQPEERTSTTVAQEPRTLPRHEPPADDGPPLRVSGRVDEPSELRHASTPPPAAKVASTAAVAERPSSSPPGPAMDPPRPSATPPSSLASARRSVPAAASSPPASPLPVPSRPPATSAAPPPGAAQALPPLPLPSPSTPPHAAVARPSAPVPASVVPAVTPPVRLAPPPPVVPSSPPFALPPPPVPAARSGLVPKREEETTLEVSDSEIDVSWDNDTTVRTQRAPDSVPPDHRAFPLRATRSGPPGPISGQRGQHEADRRRDVADRLAAIGRLPPNNDYLSLTILRSIAAMYDEMKTRRGNKARAQAIRDAFENQAHLRAGMLALLDLLNPRLADENPALLAADNNALIAAVLQQERMIWERSKRGESTGLPSRRSMHVPPARPPRSMH